MYEVYSSEMFFHRARSKRATRARAPRVNNRRNRRETGGLHPWVVSRMEAIRRFLPVTDIVIKTPGTRKLEATPGTALDLRPEGKAPKAKPAENGGNAQRQESISSTSVQPTDRMQPVFRKLSESEIVRELFAPFIRRQKVHNCLRLIDGQWQVVEAPFIDDWTARAYHSATATLKLEAGKKHSIAIEYYQKGGGANIDFKWKVKGDNHDYFADYLKKADLVIACIGHNSDTEGEGHDRSFDLPAEDKQLLNTLFASQTPVIGIVNGGGNIGMQDWEPQMNGLLWGFYGGQEAGTAAGEILFGKVNPSGKLPMTFEKKWEDNPA